MRLLPCLLCAVCALALSIDTNAQASSVIPDLSGSGGIANSSSSWPWNQATASVRAQYIYDASDMPRFPITIKKVRFRPVDFATGSWSGGTYGGIIMKMSTAAVAYNTMTTTFATNHGTDKATVFSGAAVLTAGIGNGPALPSLPYVTITLGTPFNYDPSNGAFLIDIGSDGSLYTGGTTLAGAATLNTPNKVTQLYNLSNHLALTGTIQAAAGLVVELEYDFNGTFPNFTQDKTAGLVGTSIAFKDTTITSATGGVLTWSWDLNGDGTFGDGGGVANPTYTYNTAGTFTVALRVLTGHGPFEKKKTGLVTIATAVPTVPDVIQYQFNEVRGTSVANTAVGTSTAPAFGTFSNTGWQGDPGMARSTFSGNEPGFGMVKQSGVTNDNWVNSGWPLALTGADSMSITWWQKMDSAAVGNAFGYVWGGDGSSFRCFNRGASGNSILLRGAVFGDLDAGVNLHHGNWVHLAVIVDNTAGLAQWYVDGVSAASKTFTPGSFNAANTGFTVNSHGVAGSTSSNARWYDIDDFRFYKRALSYGEVLGAMAGENASAGEYGLDCGFGGPAPKIGAVGRPVLGNSAFSIGMTGAQGASPMALVVGITAHVGGTFPLNMTPIIGCGWLEANTDLLVVLGMTSGTGTHTMSLPVPNLPGAAGVHLYAQYGYRGTATAGMTKGLDINIQEN